MMTTGKQHRINEQFMCIEYDQVRRNEGTFQKSVRTCLYTGSDLLNVQ